MSGLFYCIFLKNSIKIVKGFYALEKDRSHSLLSKTLTVYWKKKDGRRERFLRGRDIKIWKNDHVK